MRYLLMLFCLVFLFGCTQAQKDKFAKVETEVKNGVKIANEALTQVDAIVKVAAPNSTAAKNLDKATVTAQKVNGVVQNVTITIPVDPVATTPAPVPAQ